MPTPTYTPMANITLGSAASSVTFSNIPNTYRDLILISEGTATGTTGFRIQYNNDTTTANYSAIYAGGNGSSTFSSPVTNAAGVFIMTIFNRFSQITFIQDYSATDKHKSSLSRSNVPQNELLMSAGRWANTAAITSVKILTDSGQSLSSGTTLALYGVIA